MKQLTVVLFSILMLFSISTSAQDSTRPNAPSYSGCPQTVPNGIRLENGQYLAGQPEPLGPPNPFVQGRVVNTHGVLFDGSNWDDLTILSGEQVSYRQEQNWFWDHVETRNNQHFLYDVRDDGQVFVRKMTIHSRNPWGNPTSATFSDAVPVWLSAAERGVGAPAARTNALLPGTAGSVLGVVLGAVDSSGCTPTARAEPGIVTGAVTIAALALGKIGEVFVEEIIVPNSCASGGVWDDEKKDCVYPEEPTGPSGPAGPDGPPDDGGNSNPFPGPGAPSGPVDEWGNPIPRGGVTTDETYNACVVYAGGYLCYRGGGGGGGGVWEWMPWWF